MKIPLASIGLREKDIIAAQSVLNSKNLTMGSKVKDFEAAMAQYLHVKHFVMVNSGSSANLAIFEALLRPSTGEPLLKIGDGVLVPAVAWPTTIWPIIQLGLVPVFVDVDPRTISMNLELAEIATIENINVRAIFPIHPLGYGISHAKLDNFCQKHNLVQINDVCESLGSWQGNVHSGTTGLASSFSFYFSHHITTMEGGGVATNDLRFANDLRSIRSHGWSRDRSDLEEWKNSYSANLLTQSISINQSKFQFITTGFNIRPMEIQAAIGLEQLKDLNSFIIKRRRIASSLKKALYGSIFEVIDGDTLNNPDLESVHSWMLIAIKINLEMTGNLRDLIDSKLEEFGIESRPVLTGNFLNQPAVVKLSNYPPGIQFPTAELISTNYFMVGAHHDLTEFQIEYLCSKLRFIADCLIS
jgi:CDP-6-deoxy-D-xylo-4-hexulose-3-dehydrase